MKPYTYRMGTLRYFPLFMDLQDQPVLVIGAGKVAERKIRLLHKAGAAVKVVASTLNAKVEDWRHVGDIEWIGNRYQQAQLDGVHLVFAASNNTELNLSVHADAEARGIPVNVVDDRRHCRFITPAMVDRSPLQIAISSAGTSPVMARRIRAWIERLLPMGIGKIATAAGKIRYRTATLLPLEQHRNFWDSLLSRGRILQWSNLSQTAIEDNIREALSKQQKHDALNNPIPGKVFLVGAGPGRPDLLTIRALQVLGQADVILHDKLVSGEILDMARRDADFIDVGKRAGTRQQSQQQINRLLAQQAQLGKQVVRLKGGDAFIFGRGGEELEYLQSYGIEFEVVPGISAAIGCAAYAGIPLTHRDHAQTLSFVTGQVSNDNQTPDWHQLAGTGRTAVVYMGVKQAVKIRRQLLTAGLDGTLPVALVANGTRPNQQVLHGTINELPTLARKLPTGAPGLFVIGEVTTLGKKLAWFESEPKIIRVAA